MPATAVPVQVHGRGSGVAPITPSAGMARPCLGSTITLESRMQTSPAIAFYISVEPEVFDMPTGEDISGRCCSTSTTCCCLKLFNQ